MPALFARAVEEIAALKPDLLVLSGDLVDYPLELMDDDLLRPLAVKDLELVADLLDQVPCPQVLVYGNHDHPQLFHEVFDPLALDQHVDCHRVLAFLDAEGEHNVPVRTGAERQRFTDALDAADSAPQIHVQHYLVWPQRNDSYPHTYAEGERMRRRIAASGRVELVLSGHYHAGVEPLLSDGVWFATVPAFGEPPHPYWIYELDDHGLAWTQREISL